MPLFFILSGYLFKTPNKEQYLSMVKKKCKRLLLPFFSIAVIFFLAKYYPSKLLKLYSPVTLQSFFNIFIDPTTSHIQLLWFIYTLFLIFLTYPMMRHYIKNDYLLLSIFVLLSLVINTHIFFINTIIKNSPFFIIGIILSRNRYLFKRTETRRVTLNTVFFIFLYSAINFLPGFQNNILSNPVINSISKLILGVTGSLIVINLSSILYKYNGLASLFKLLGVYSMSIYLFHTLFEGTIRVIFFQILEYSWFPFEIVAIIAVVSGTLFPLLMEKYLLRPIPLTRKIILGLEK